MTLNGYIRKAAKVLRNQIEYIPVKRITYNYMKNLLEMNQLEILARTIKKCLNLTTIRTAVLGYDPRLFGYLETLLDFGFVIQGHYESQSDDRFHPSSPLQQLNLDDVDIVILGCTSEGEENALLEKTRTFVSRSGGIKCPLVRMRKLRRLYSVLSRLRIAHFSSCLNPSKIALVALCLSATPPDGCIIECGTYRGGTSTVMGLLVDAWSDSRRIHTFDTFEGMPKPAESDGETVYQQGLFSDASYRSVLKHFRAHGLGSNIYIHKGLVQEMLPCIWSQESKVSFALVDTDQYLGTVHSLREILPRLSRNGIIIVDDYYVEGVKRAVAEATRRYPTVRGAIITYNFYMLWDQTDSVFLSHWRL
jgi:hypothetical protein